MPHLRRAAAANLVFGYANILFAVISGIVLVPVYLRFFDLSAYGAWLASGNILAMLTVLDGGLNLVFAQRLAVSYRESHRDQFSTVAGAGLTLSFGLAAVIVLCAVSVSYWVPLLVNAHTEQWRMLRIGFILGASGTGLVLCQLALGAVTQAWQRTFFAGVTASISTFAGILGTIGGLWTGLGIASIGLGIFVRGLTGFVLLGIHVVRAWRIMRLPRPRIDRTTLWELILTTTPVALGRTGSVVAGNSQAPIVAIFLGPGEAAVLALTGRVYDIVKMVLAPVGSAVFAGLAHLTVSASIQRMRITTREILVLSGVIAAVGFGSTVALNEAFLLLWVGPESFGGSTLSILTCLSAAASARVNLIGMVLAGMGEIGRTSWAMFAELLLQIPLMLVLMWWADSAGAPLSALLSVLLLSGWYFHRMLAVRLRYNGCSIRIATAGLIPIAVTVPAGILWQALVGRPASWPGFLLQTVACSLLLSILALSVSRPARQMIRALLDKAGLMSHTTPAASP